MCGRAYHTYSDEELFFKYLKRGWNFPIEKSTLEIKPNYNLCPSQVTPIVSLFEGSLGIREMRWGLVPSWAKTVKDADKYSMTNAKAEEIREKRSYKVAFQKRRCIVPVSGFYEWKKDGTKKRPFAISLKTTSIMSLAGISEHWVSSDTGEVVDSFSIVTTSANSFMSNIHTRMPVILSSEQEESWLDPKSAYDSHLAPLMSGCSSEILTAIEITSLVNSPKNNSPEVLVPAQLS